MGQEKKPFILGFSTFILIFMVASLPFAHPSRLLQVRTLIVAPENTNTKGFQMEQLASRFGIGGGGAMVVTAVEDSARQVPAGPDPLHHYNHPVNHP